VKRGRVPALMIATLSLGVANAQVRDTSAYLTRMDANHDGVVQLVEYQDWLSDTFDRMDRDRDGTLSRDELPGGRGQPVTRVEWRARLETRFRAQDTNRDGVLSARELSAPPR